MIQKLKKKFILINMSIVTLLLCIILGLVFYFTSANLEQESLSMMRNIAAQPFRLDTPEERGEDVRLPFFALQLGPDGDLLAKGGGYYDLSDAAFLDSLIDAANFVQLIEKRQSVKIAALEEIAYNRGWIDRDTLLKSAARYGKSPYGEHLKRVAEGRFLYDSSTTE